MQYTKHARVQMSARKISSATVQNAIRTGVRLVNRTDPNKYTYVDNKNKVYVVTNNRSDIVITVFHKEK